jgi:Protein of unknown function (DUF3300)
LRSPPVGQIEATVAPVALYPDALLTPSFLRIEARKNMTADNYRQIDPRENPWDPSVKALVPFPIILDMIVERRDWMKPV